MSILLLETIHQDAQALLQTHSHIIPPGELQEPDREAVEAIITRGRGRITASLLNSLPNVKVIARCGAGLDNLDLKAAHDLGIPVVYAPGKTSYAVAEHTILLILSMARRLCYLSEQVKKGNWDVRVGYTGLELRGKTLGIIGMGATGQKVALLGQAFGMKIVYWNRSPLDIEYTSLSIDELLSTSDVVTLHTALTDDTRHLLGPLQLSMMPKHSLLVNTARGGLVDEDALLEALQANKLAGYATDLLTKDPPPPNHPLLNHPLTLITPHSAVLTDATYREICVFTARNVLHMLNGLTPDVGSVYS